MLFEGFDDGDMTALGTSWALFSCTPDTVNKHQSNGFPTSAKSMQIGAALSPVFATGHRWIHLWQRWNGGGNMVIVTLRRSGVKATSIVLDVLSTWTVQIKRGDQNGTVLASSASINAAVPHLFWIYADPKNVAGDVRIYMDLSVTPLVQYTGDTTDANVDDFDQLELATAFTNAQFDDIAVLTDVEKQQMFGIGAGVANPPTQELFVASFAPTGNGTVQLTPSVGGSLNFQMVDERPFNTADYNEGTAIGQFDLFTWNGMNFVPTIMCAVKVDYYGSRDGIITGISTKLQSGVTVSTPAAQAVGPASTSALRENYWMLDPDTGVNWTVAGVNATQFGYQLAG